jgi:DNA invertase Pin-like site-specific DNA recombinase
MMPAVGHFLVYVRRSYVKAGSPDVSDEQQVASVLPLLPPGATHEVIADSLAGDGRRKHSGRTDERDGYRELIRRVQAGGVDGIAVYEIGRLARNARLMLNLKDELERRQLPILVGAMPNTRFDTAMGRYIFGQLALAAQLQADLDSERMVAMTRGIFEAGGHRGNDPFGYRSQRIGGRRELAVVSEEARIVREVFLALTSHSFSATAEQLNEAGDYRRGRRWTEDAVKDIWRRRRLYLGFVTWRRGLEERPGRHEPILDEELVRNALAGVGARQRAAVRRAPSRRVYLLSGLLVCSCGRRMRAATRVARGQAWSYYTCPDRHGSVRTDDADTVVLDAVRAGVLPPAAIEEARELLRERLAVPQTADSAELRRRLAQRQERLGDRYEWGELDEAEYRARRDQVQRQLDAIPDDEKLVRFEAYRQIAVSVAEALEAFTAEQRQELVRILIERVTVRNRQVTASSIAWSPPMRPFFERVTMAPPEGIEPPTQALGRPRSIR